MNPSAFVCYESVFNLVLQEILSGYKILGWQFVFSFSILKMLLSAFCFTFIPNKNLAVVLILFLYMQCFPLTSTLFKIFYLSLAFN